MIGIRITGGTITGGVVIIEDCLIDGNFAGAAHGISDERTGGGKLYISNTTVRNVGSKGITIDPGVGSSAGQRIDATLDTVRAQNNSQFGATFCNSARVMINRSVFSGNTAAGIAVQALLAAGEVNISSMPAER